MEYLLVFVVLASVAALWTGTGGTECSCLNASLREGVRVRRESGAGHGQGKSGGPAGNSTQKPGVAGQNAGNHNKSNGGKASNSTGAPVSRKGGHPGGPGGGHGPPKNRTGG